MLGGLGNLTNLMKQAKQMQSQWGEMQKEILARRFEGEAGGGAVVATVDGRGMLIDIKISPNAIGDVELLEDLIKGAVAVAAKKAGETMQEELSKLTGGLNIPGLNEMFGAPPATGE